MTKPTPPADVERILARTLADHRAALDALAAEHLGALDRLATDIAASWAAGGKLMVCGNGGSAADSQHLAAELSGRYQAQRPGWPAMALTTDTSALTAVSNDFGFDHVFARQVEALGRTDDVLLVISTSGHSPNCIEAVRMATRIGMKTHGLLGKDGGPLNDLTSSSLIVPAQDTPRIQELHITMIHILCELLETRLLSSEPDHA